MSDETKASAGRAIEIEARIAAPAEAVWRALTESAQLRSWFAPDARVEPGEGGSIWMSWGAGVEGTAMIEVWEPNAHLRLVEQWAGARTTIDWFITAESGEQTVLRLVHSGFGDDAEWDDFYEGTLSGWSYFVRHLQIYLERLRGMTRTMLKQRRAMKVPRELAWRHMLACAGVAAASIADAGAVVDLVFGTERTKAVVEVARAPGVLGLRLPEHGDAMLMVELEPGGESWHCGIWLSTYGLPDAQQERLRKALDRFADEVCEDEGSAEPAQ